MCKHKILAPWPGHEEVCNGFSHTYRDLNNKPITPLMFGEDIAGEFRAVCPDAEWWKPNGGGEPPWERTEDEDVLKRRAMVDAFFIYKDQTLENYNKSFNGHEEEVRAVRMFLQDERIKHLVLKGDVGRGKSHLAQACINAARPAMKGHALMMSAQRLYWMLREVENFEPDEIALKAYWRFQRARMLALDDLGTEKQTETQVFNQGLKDLLDTFSGRLIITTNLGDKEMQALYGAKITSRLYENALVVILKGKDFRTSN